MSTDTTTFVDPENPPHARVYERLLQAYRLAGPTPKHVACADLAGVAIGVARYAYETGWRAAGIPPICETLALERTDQLRRARGEVAPSERDEWADRVRRANDRGAEDLVESRALTGRVVKGMMERSLGAAALGGFMLQQLMPVWQDIAADIQANPTKYKPKDIAYLVRTSALLLQGGAATAKVADEMGRRELMDRRGEFAGVGAGLVQTEEDAILAMAEVARMYEEDRRSGVIEVEAWETGEPEGDPASAEVAVGEDDGVSGE